MKRLLLLSVLFVFACSGDDSEDSPTPVYTVEGKWLWSPNTEDRSYANTMYEFENGIRYTSYAVCWPELCTDADFNALTSSDRIPGTETYTFEGDLLTIDGMSHEVTFECDGGILLFSNGTKLWRLSSPCN